MINSCQIVLQHNFKSREAIQSFAQPQSRVVAVDGEPLETPRKDLVISFNTSLAFDRQGNLWVAYIAPLTKTLKAAQFLGQGHGTLGRVRRGIAI